MKPPAGLPALPAREQARLVRERAVSARELVQAHLERIEEINPRLNAIVTLVPDQALRDADAADRRSPTGPLHGLPMAIKDVEDVAGVRTTYGSTLFANHVPDADSPLVARLRAAGAIVIGKTNTPEFGAGSHTFNAVFGTTRNPHDTARSAGGSSGGAAAAVAAHLIPLADGSDLGGSIRNPAGFCGIIGLRPTPGRIPDPASGPWNPLPVYGPLARDAGDAALFMRAAAGPDPRAPISIDEPPDVFAEPLPTEVAGLRIAWSEDLGGLPVEPEVTAALAPMRAALEALGCEVHDDAPDLGPVDDAFEVLRGVAYAGLAELLDRGGLKATVVENVRYGLALTGGDVARALAEQAAAFEAMRRFLTRYDALALPAAQVAPFPVEVEYPTTVAGVRMGSYIEWMRACSRITVTGHPAIAVPGSTTPAGLPVGLQVVGRMRADTTLLGLAAALEAAGIRRPVV